MVEGLSTHHWAVVFPILLILLLLWGLLESTSWVRSLRIVMCTEGLFMKQIPNLCVLQALIETLLEQQ